MNPPSAPTICLHRTPQQISSLSDDFPLQWRYEAVALACCRSAILSSRPIKVFKRAMQPSRYANVKTQQTHYRNWDRTPANRSSNDNTAATHKRLLLPASSQGTSSVIDNIQVLVHGKCQLSLRMTRTMTTVSESQGRHYD